MQWTKTVTATCSFLSSPARGWERSTQLQQQECVLCHQCSQKEFRPGFVGSLMAQKWFVNASHPGYGGAGPFPYVGGEFLHSGAGPSVGCGGIPGDPEKPNLSSESEDRPPRRPPFVSPSFPSSRASFSTADGESQLPHHVANYHCHGAALPIWASHLEPGSLSEGPQPFQRAGQVARADFSRVMSCGWWGEGNLGIVGVG